MDGASDLTRLPVRSRQLVGEGGRQRTELTVYCPFRQRSTDLEHCEDCTAFVGTRTALGATWHEVPAIASAERWTSLDPPRCWRERRWREPRCRR